jgi:DNA primase
MSNWIDFRQLRQDADLTAVLRHYGVQLRIRGSQGQGFCPLPTHRGRRRSPSFSVNFDKKIWQCFGCQARGNVIDFAVRMEGHQPSDTQAVREVCEMLQRDFVHHARSSGDRPRIKRPPQDRRPPLPNVQSDALVNPPLDFRLRNLDAAHPYLKERHLKRVTIEHFELGFCSLGMLKGRIAIPLHDAAGRLIGYAGRVINEESVSEENPKYRFPGRREYQGKVIEFHKNRFLYNGYRVRNASNLLVVEGFPSAWWLWQSGYPQVVSLMGSSCSKEQARLIAASVPDDGTVWVLSDGDRGGELCAQTMIELVGPHRRVERLQLSEGCQPTDLSVKELRKLIPFRADKSGTSFKHRGDKRGSNTP